MSWKKVSDIVKDSLIDLRGVEYKVIENKHSDLLVAKVSNPAFVLSLETLIDIVQNDDWEGSAHEIYVKSEPKPQIPQYTAARKPGVQEDFVHSEIQSRFAAKGPSLEDQLKAATAGTTPERKVFATAVAGPSLEDQLRAARTESGISEVRSQLAGVGVQAASAAQGVARVDQAVEKVAKLNSERHYNVQGQMSRVEGSVRNVQNQATELSWHVQSVQDDVENVVERVSSLEHQALEARINQDLNTQKSAKAQGGNSMSIKKLLGNFTGLFGKVEGQFAYSPAGLAVRKNPNEYGSNWIVYDAKTRSLTDVQDLVLDFNIPAFQLPVTEDAVNEGDIILNNGKFQYVVEINDGYVKTISPSDSSYSSVIPTRNQFLNKTFYTTVKTLSLAGEGGFDPMLLMAMNKGGDKQDLLPFLLMSGGLGGNGAAATGGIDPMMLALIGDNTEDLLPFLLLQQGGVADKGINPLMLLLMTDKGGDSKDSLLPLLLMGGGLGGAGGAQAGGIQSMLPFLLMSGDKGGDSGIKDILMMQALGGGAGFGNLFGGTAPAATPVTPAAPAAE
jgi:hypothetical protein